MATRTNLPLEPETGTELCRVRLEGGSLGGYRSDILTENLSERENSMLTCLRCEGIMKDASISNDGEQLCICCKREDEQMNPSANVRNTILSLKCACPLSKRGCEWLGRLDNVENHLTTCGHVYESCQLLCGIVTTRDEMGRHVREECSQREEMCLHCSGVNKVCEMVEHVKVCGKVFVLCELGCATRVRRESILFHLSSECSEESVVCPYEKYRCEVVGLKRRELKQHLEENRSLHTELKLTVMEENYLRKNELLERRIQEIQSEFKLEMDIKNREIEFLKGLHIRHESKVKWTVRKITDKFKPNSVWCYSDLYEVAGYSFQLKIFSDAQNFTIYFDLTIGLEWPFKASFITRVICQRDIKNSLIFKSPLIIVSQRHFTESCPEIASIPLSTDLKEFIESDSLELEVTVRILKNIEF